MDLALNKDKGFKIFLKICGNINNEYEMDEKYVNIILKIRDKLRPLNMLQQHRGMWKEVEPI